MLFSVFMLTINFTAQAQIKGCDHPCNLVMNGNFESGNTGFGSDFSMAGANCATSSVKVVSVFKDKCNSWPATGSGSGKFLAVDGSPSEGNKIIWKTDVRGCCGLTYSFNFRAANLYGAAGAEKIELLVNGNVICSVNVDSKDWTLYGCTFTGCPKNIALRQVNGADKSDIGIDDIFFGFCSCPCTGY